MKEDIERFFALPNYDPESHFWDFRENRGKNFPTLFGWEPRKFYYLIWTRNPAILLGTSARMIKIL